MEQGRKASEGLMRWRCKRGGRQRTGAARRPPCKTLTGRIDGIVGMIGNVKAEEEK